MSDGIDRSKVVWQRSFRVPYDKLDVVLVKIGMLSSNMGHFTADYIFKSKRLYDVVVNEYGCRYPYQENQLEKFVASIHMQNDLDRKPFKVWLYEHWGGNFELVLFDGENTYWHDGMEPSSGYSNERLNKICPTTDSRFIEIGDL